MTADVVAVVFVEVGSIPRGNPSPCMPPDDLTLVLTAPVDEMLTIMAAFRPEPS